MRRVRTGQREVPQPFDEEAIARYADEVLPEGDVFKEENYPQWRKAWTETALRPRDLDDFTVLHVRFPRSRMRQFSQLAKQEGVSRDSLVRRLCAEFIIAKTGDTRDSVEHDFPIATGAYDKAESGLTREQHEHERRRVQDLDF